MKDCLLVNVGIRSDTKEEKTNLQDAVSDLCLPPSSLVCVLVCVCHHDSRKINTASLERVSYRHTTQPSSPQTSRYSSSSYYII